MFIAICGVLRDMSLKRRIGLLNTEEKISTSLHFNNEKDAEIALEKATPAQMPVNCTALFLPRIFTSSLSQDLCCYYKGYSSKTFTADMNI